MRSCKECEKDFEPKISRQVFCCKKCGVKHGGRQHYCRNKEARDAKRKEWADKNKDHLQKYMKVYMQDYINPNKKAPSKKKKNPVAKKVKIKAVKLTPKKYQPDYKEHIAEYQRDYQKNRRDTDPLFKLKGNLRGRINYAFKAGGYKKITKTEQLLGTDFETAFKHLSSLFTEGMTWDNHGEWEIDHITPFASAKTENDIINLCHYKNLQPLWKEDNRKKGAKTDD